MYLLVICGIRQRSCWRAPSFPIAAPLLDTAKWAAPITKGLVPYSFDSTTRTRLPPMLTAAIWRMV
jgi:hypothetical protein